MHVSEAEFLSGISPFLGGYYLFLALVNAVVAFHLWHNRHRTGEAAAWVLVSLALVVIWARPEPGVVTDVRWNFAI